jgi:uncharacterized protein (TIGR03067 family)
MNKLLTVMVVTLLVAADAPKGDDPAKKDKLEGSWAATAMERGGQPAPPELVKGLKLTFKGDKVTLLMEGENKEATYKADSTKKPATLDITPTDGPEKGKTMKGIFVIEGDTLKIAMPEGEGERPTEFVTKSGSSTTLVTLKRETK